MSCYFDYEKWNKECESNMSNGTNYMERFDGVKGKLNFAPYGNMEFFNGKQMIRLAYEVWTKTVSDYPSAHGILNLIMLKLESEEKKKAKEIYLSPKAFKTIQEGILFFGCRIYGIPCSESVDVLDSDIFKVEFEDNGSIVPSSYAERIILANMNKCLEYSEKRNSLNVRKVYVDKAKKTVVVIFDDDTKRVMHCDPKDKFDVPTACMYAIIEKKYGSLKKFEKEIAKAVQERKK